MAEAKSPSPTFTYVASKRLPPVVEGVIKEIQKHMMDDLSDRSQPRTIPSMPIEFICSEITDNKKKIVDIAGEDRRQSEYPMQCYQIIVPFLMRRLKSGRTLQPSLFLWSGNVISLSSICSSQSDFAAMAIKRVVTQVKNRFTGERETKIYDISTDIKELPSKPLRKFLQSSLVSKQPTGHYLVSSHKMTITWLRSRLDRALNKYREVEKDVEVVATIKQKDGGPLFLRLHVEKKNHRSTDITKYDFLFTFCPSFRLSQCQLVVPVYNKLDTIPSTFKTSDEHCLWKKVIRCDDTSPKHKHNVADFTDNFSQLHSSRTASEQKVEPTKLGSNEKEAYKASINRIREMTSFQVRQSKHCLNPASRMLLEYYYQYGHIPDNEMRQAESFVWEILTFLKASILEDRKQNDPEILEFVKSGSVAEKLKVVQPDEFDVMITIDLPQSTQCYTFLEDDSFPTGYAICQVRRSKSFSCGLKRCFRKSDEFSHCLAPEQLAFGWLYGKLERAINKYKNNSQAPPKANLKLRRGGPALLLEISPSTPSVLKLPEKISVDLVLALKLSEDDSRYAVAKRAKEEQFYKKVVKELQPTGKDEHQKGLTNSSLDKNRAKRQGAGPVYSLHSNEGRPKALRVQVQDTTAFDTKRELARKNLKYLWRISYSAQEKRYLEYVREVQQRNGVEGCQNICLMILKTICTREILKREQSVICHKLSSYLLKTALFHVLAKTNWIEDWKMNNLADRYVDLLDQLSKWKELPHFFFNNASSLIEVFPDDEWCKLTTAKNLLDELHATLRIQLLNRFVHIANSFKECKLRMDMRSMQLSKPATDQRFGYKAFLTAVLGSARPEEVIHPPFDKSARPDEEGKKSLVKAEAEDRKVSKAAKYERKSGPRSDPGRNLERPEEDEKKSRDRQQRHREPVMDYLLGFNEHDDADSYLVDTYLHNAIDDYKDDVDFYDYDDYCQDSPEFWDYWNH